MVVLHIYRDAERDSGGGRVKYGNFSVATAPNIVN